MRQPQARIEIVEALPMFLAEWVEEGRLDLGVFIRSGSPDPNLSAIAVGVDELRASGTAECSTGWTGRSASSWFTSRGGSTSRPLALERELVAVIQGTPPLAELRASVRTAARSARSELRGEPVHGRRSASMQAADRLSAFSAG